METAKTIETVDWELEDFQYRNNRHTQIMKIRKGGVQMLIAFDEDPKPYDTQLVRVLANGEEVEDEEVESRLGCDVGYHVNSEGETWYKLTKEQVMRLKASY